MKIADKYPTFSLGLGLIFGGATVVFYKELSLVIPVFIIGGFRYVLQAGYFYMSHKQWKRTEIKKLNKAIALNTVLTVLMLAAWILSIEHTKVLNIVFGNLLVPVFTYIGSILYLKEKASRKALLGSAVALIGSLILFGEPLFNGEETLGSELFGNILVLVTSILSAAVLIQAKEVYKFGDYRELLAKKSFVAGLVFFVIAAISYQSGSAGEVGIKEVLYFLGFILAFGILENIFFWSSYKRVRAEDAAPLLYIQPLTGFILGLIVLGERMSNTSIIAAFIVIAGVLVAHPVHHKHHFHIRNPFTRYNRELKKWIRIAVDDVEKAVKKL